MLNIMRMAMGVVMIADIATPAGKQLLQCAFLLQSGNHLRDDYDWPRDPPGDFPPAMLLLWQNALKASVLDPYAPPNSSDLQFSKQVRAWTDSTIKTKWIAFFCQTTDRIYYKAGLQWRVYARYSGAGGRGRNLQRTSSHCRPTDFS